MTDLSTEKLIAILLTRLTKALEAENDELQNMPSQCPLDQASEYVKYVPTREQVEIPCRPDMASVRILRQVDPTNIGKDINKLNHNEKFRIDVALPSLVDGEYHKDEFPVMFWPNKGDYNPAHYLTNYGRIVMELPRKTYHTSDVQGYMVLKPGRLLDTETLNSCHVLDDVDMAISIVKTFHSHSQRDSWSSSIRV